MDGGGDGRCCEEDADEVAEETCAEVGLSDMIRQGKLVKLRRHRADKSAQTRQEHN